MAPTGQWMACVIALVVAPLGTAANQVLTVDPAGGPGSYTQIQSAVDVAQEGDIVLVHPGTYDAVVVLGKSVAILADSQGAAVPAPTVASVEIANLSAAQSVTVRGLRVDVLAFANDFRVYAHDNDGSVILEDVEVAPGLLANGPNAAAILVEKCKRVAVTRCSAVGFLGFATANGGIPPSPAVRCIDSTVALYDGSYTGGDGADAELSLQFTQVIPGQVGGAGVIVDGGTLLVAGASVTGGSGGDGYFFNTCHAERDGGPGVNVDGAAVVFDAILSGGSPGAPAAACPSVASTGPASTITMGSLTTLAESYRALEVTSPNPVGSIATTTVHGVPGELAILLISFAPDGTYVPGLKGTLIGAAPLLVFVLGPLPASGVLSFGVVIPPGVPAGFDGFHLYEQVAVPGADGFGLLSSPSVVTIVR